jgi:probable F420-dependent oxidoreductase
MKFGISMPTRPPLMSPDNVVAILNKAEELDFGYAAIPDHIIPPGEFKGAYPYTSSGSMTWGPSGDVIEMLAYLMFAAAHTTKLRVMTGVAVLPLRNPLFMAKALTTVDVLSKGRLTVGCGTGWEQNEFEALGVPPFEERGAVTTEYIRLFKELWTKDAPNFDGKYVKFSDKPFLPKPVQKPHPPIWIGGESPASMRRAAQVGDCWWPIGSNRTFPLDTPKRFAAGLQKFKQICDEVGRDPKEIILSYCPLWYSEAEAQILESGERRAFTGNFQQVADDIKAFEDLGVENIIFGLQAPTVELTLGRMERLVERVLPLTKA